MNKVDTHIIMLEKWWDDEKRKEWFELCINSIKDQPTNVHIIEGVDGHIGKGRAMGFAAGSAEYVSFADPDDYLEPNAIQNAIDFLDANPNIDVCCSSENVIDEDGLYLRTNRHGDLYKSVNSRSVLHIHHLVVMRRKAVEPYLDFIAEHQNHSEFALWFEMYKDGIQFDFIDSIGYNWRTHEDSAHHLVPPDKKQMERMQEVFRSFQGPVAQRPRALDS